eukprot:CAMPEP_0198117632 /NCGR_PEP_ID=MMETSP1442-20131203/18732_1 /TAXON_ID= /ORGANISM="Craspedostauros australis, Strain CCMP3328" /LENGTH=202 /DNA_ID=CAMNT_0043775725 /DNA_START=203 /DNA_END=811 /DNA_ORIENTATION=+
MMRNTSFVLLAALCACVGIGNTAAFSLSMETSNGDINGALQSSRRGFLTTSVGTAAGLATGLSLASSQPAFAADTAPQIFKTAGGTKYAVLKDKSSGNYPQKGDIVAIEYTGYLINGKIFDGTHSEGKQNVLLFQLGSTAVIPGINDMVAEMKVGQKVQAIIPPELAFGDKGICLEDGECLVKPGSTLVYDILLKKSSIPPP